MPNVSSFGAQTDNAVVSGTVTDRQMIIPEVPPQGLMSVGPRQTPNFVKPREWNARTTYHFFDAVRDTAGSAYVATKPVVPAGTPLTNEDYWFLWADPDTRFDDLNETVKTFNQRITQNTNDIATKAPINHASEETVYGTGNEVNYGHVRLAVDDTPMTSDANAGIAATPKMVSDVFLGNAVYIGNSYTYDYAGMHGIHTLTKKFFANTYSETVDGNGFLTYSNHQTTFNDQVNSVYKKVSNPDSITHVFFIDAVGDPRAINQGKTSDDFISAVNTACTNAKNKFPNAKIYIYKADFTQYSDTPNGVGFKFTWSELANIHKWLSEPNENFIYLGWGGWQLMHKPGMMHDTVHPNQAGYNILANTMMQMLNGNYNYPVYKGSIDATSEPYINFRYINTIDLLTLIPIAGKRSEAIAENTTAKINVPAEVFSPYGTSTNSTVFIDTNTMNTFTRGEVSAIALKENDAINIKFPKGFSTATFPQAIGTITF